MGGPGQRLRLPRPRVAGGTAKGRGNRDDIVEGGIQGQDLPVPAGTMHRNRRHGLGSVLLGGNPAHRPIPEFPAPRHEGPEQNKRPE